MDAVGIDIGTRMQRVGEAAKARSEVLGARTPFASRAAAAPLSRGRAGTGEGRKRGDPAELLSQPEPNSWPPTPPICGGPHAIFLWLA